MVVDSLQFASCLMKCGHVQLPETDLIKWKEVGRKTIPGNCNINHDH